MALFLIAFFGFTLSSPFALGKLLAVALVGLWLAHGKVYTKVYTWPLAYLLALEASTLLSADPWLSAVGLWGTYNTGLLCAVALIPFWTCVDSRHKEGLEAGLRWGAVLMAIIGLCQKMGVEFLTPFPLPTGDRVYSSMGSPVYVGAMAALCFPYCKSRFEKALLIGLVWATGSRGAYVAVACGALYQTWPRISERVRYWGLVAIGGGLSLAFWLRPLSDLGRVVVWRAAWDAFLARPWFGWGTGNYLMVADVYRNPLWDEVYGNTTQDHAHNLFLEAMACGGIVGLIALCFFLYVHWTYTAYNRPARAALLGVFLVGMLNPLPLVAKALCLALAASCSARDVEIVKPFRITSSLISIIAAFAVAWLATADRIVTVYGQEPWSFSSVRAALHLGIIRQQ